MPIVVAAVIMVLVLVPLIMVKVLAVAIIMVMGLVVAVAVILVMVLVVAIVAVAVVAAVAAVMEINVAKETIIRWNQMSTVRNKHLHHGQLLEFTTSPFIPFKFFFELFSTKKSVFPKSIS